MWQRISIPASKFCLAAKGRSSSTHFHFLSTRVSFVGIPTFPNLVEKGQMPHTAILVFLQLHTRLLFQRCVWSRTRKIAREKSDRDTSHRIFENIWPPHVETSGIDPFASWTFGVENSTCGNISHSEGPCRETEQERSFQERTTSKSFSDTNTKKNTMPTNHIVLPTSSLSTFVSFPQRYAPRSLWNVRRYNFR